MILSLSRKLVVYCDMMEVVGHCDIPWEVEVQDTDLHIHWGDIQEAALDVRAYLADESSDHFFHHSDLVGLDEVMGASDDNDEDVDHENDHADLRGFHYSNDEVHGDEGMGRVVVLEMLHAFQDD